MDKRLLSFLCCPVTREPLELQLISAGTSVVTEGILFSREGWFYPIIDGIPRLNVESFIDHEAFLQVHLTDYSVRRKQLQERYPGLIAYVLKKNRKTRQSFSLEWSLYDYSGDRVWAANQEQLLDRFLEETGETAEGLEGKLILDAGCGNGLLDSYIAEKGATVVAMDISNSIERAYRQNRHPNAWFIQGDLQFPPLKQDVFDIVQCSGVLHHTNNTELSFSCLDTCVRPGGIYSVWLYEPRKDRLHQLFNFVRRFTSKLPARWNYYLLYCTALPVSYVWKRLKKNRQNRREIMIDLMDWFSPEFRREHTPDETQCWYSKRGYQAITVTSRNIFGFNITGKK